MQAVVECVLLLTTTLQVPCHIHIQAALPEVQIMAPDNLGVCATPLDALTPLCPLQVFSLPCRQRKDLSQLKMVGCTSMLTSSPRPDI